LHNVNLTVLYGIIIYLLISYKKWDSGTVPNGTAGVSPIEANKDRPQ
jgi:hypothetical protein